MCWRDLRSWWHWLLHRRQLQTPQGMTTTPRPLSEELRRFLHERDRLRADLSLAQYEAEVLRRHREEQ